MTMTRVTLERGSIGPVVQTRKILRILERQGCAAHILNGQLPPSPNVFFKTNKIFSIFCHLKLKLIDGTLPLCGSPLLNQVAVANVASSFASRTKHASSSDLFERRGY